MEILGGSAIGGELRLSYLVREAGWNPRYNVRVADVYQATGEAWQDVKLTLSTGNPSRRAAVPDLVTWHLAPGSRPPFSDLDDPVLVGKVPDRVHGLVTDASGSPLIGATISVAGTSVGTVSDLTGSFTLDLPPGKSILHVSFAGYQDGVVTARAGEMHIVLQDGVELEEVVVLGYSGAGRNAVAQRSQPARTEALPPVTVTRQPTTRTYTIDLPYSIPADGSGRTVEIRRFSVPARYQHRATPKMNERVFLTASIHDWERYELISGEMQLFLGGALVGTSTLDTDLTADSLSLALGVDPGVTIRRERSKKYRRDAGPFALRQEVQRGWNLAVRNGKAVPVDLVVTDQVPVTADSRIDIQTDLPAGAAFDEASGELRWFLSLPAGASWRDGFGYRIRFPGNARIYLE